MLTFVLVSLAQPSFSPEEGTTGLFFGWFSVVVFHWESVSACALCSLVFFPHDAPPLRLSVFVSPNSLHRDRFQGCAEACVIRVGIMSKRSSVAGERPQRAMLCGQGNNTGCVRRGQMGQTSHDGCVRRGQMGRTSRDGCVRSGKRDKCPMVGV